jgi:hypothetical protein
LAEGLEGGQAEGVVLVGLAFGVLAFPGLGGGVGDLGGESAVVAAIEDPAGEGAGLKGDDAGLDRFEGFAEFRTGSRDSMEACLCGSGVVGAGDGRAFAEVEGENGAGGGRGRGRQGKLLWGEWDQGTVTTLRLPPPRLAWILSS